MSAGVPLNIALAVVLAVAAWGWLSYRGRYDQVWMVMHAYAYYKKGQVIGPHDVPWRAVCVTAHRDKPGHNESGLWVVVKVVDSMHIRVRPLPPKRDAA